MSNNQHLSCVLKQRPGTAVYYNLPSCLMSTKHQRVQIILSSWVSFSGPPFLLTVRQHKVFQTEKTKEQKECVELHLLQSAFHEMVAQVKVNIPSHSPSSPPTFCLRPSVSQLRRVHTLACSHLHSTPSMLFTRLTEERGRRGR